MGVNYALDFLERTIFTKVSEMWLSRGSYGVYVAVMKSMWLLRGLRPVLFRKKKIAFRGSYGTDLREGVTTSMGTCMGNDKFKKLIACVWERKMLDVLLTDINSKYYTCNKRRTPP